MRTPGSPPRIGRLLGAAESPAGPVRGLTASRAEAGPAPLLAAPVTDAGPAPGAASTRATERVGGHPERALNGSAGTTVPRGDPATSPGRPS